MSEQERPSMEPPPDRPPAWTNEEELQALVRRLLDHQIPGKLYPPFSDAGIVDFTIKDMRKLIEAFLAAARVDPDLADRVVGNDADEQTQRRAKPLDLRIIGCTIDSCDCWGLHIACSLSMFACHFAGAVSFKSSTFGGDATFDSCNFGGHAWFHFAIFSGSATFNSATFSGAASFEKSIFAGAARFYSSAFTGLTWFGQVAFGGEAWFFRATFFDDVRFNASIFSDAAQFSKCTFRSDPFFDHTTFGGGASFYAVSFGGRASFSGAEFGGDAEGDLDLANVRGAHIGRALTRAERAKGWLEWVRVRALGEWSVLTKVSVVALIAAPVLAEVWPAVRAGVNAAQRVWERAAGPAIETGAASGSSAALDTPYFPLSLALAFFAAVAVTVARALYEIGAPAAIRADDERGFIERKVARYESLRASGHDAAAAKDALRDATEKIAAIGRLRPDRHPNFVRRFGETVWIPPRDHIEWFEDPEVGDGVGDRNDEALSPRPPLPGGEGEEGESLSPGPSPKGRGGEAESLSPGPSPKGRGGEAESLSPGPSPKGRGGEAESLSPGPSPMGRGEGRRPRVGDPGLMSGAERARVAIEEGARAEYLMLAAEKPGLAWASGLLYAVAVVLILVIFGIQLWMVAKESSWLAFGALAVGAFFVVGAWAWRFQKPGWLWRAVRGRGDESESQDKKADHSGD